METRLPVLQSIRVATPCTASWAQMAGDDKTRFCDQCQMSVHNFSAMTEGEILRLLENAGGNRVCGRLFRRADGTIITQDCPVGLAALRRRVAKLVAGAAAAVISALGLFACMRSGSPRATAAAPTTVAPAAPAPPAPAPVTSVTQVEPIKTLCEWIAPEMVSKPVEMMGDIAYVAPKRSGK